MPSVVLPSHPLSSHLTLWRDPPPSALPSRRPPRSPSSACLPRPLPLRASSTSSRLYISPYPPCTVLGVSEPASSRFRFAISARARSRSDDSRVSRDASAAGAAEDEGVEVELSATDDDEDDCGKCRDEDGEGSAEVDGRVESRSLINVSGSCVDLRAMSLVLYNPVSFRQTLGRHKGTYLRPSSNSVTFSRSSPRAVYQGRKSFSGGASRTPFSVSCTGTGAFFAATLAWIAEATALCHSNRI